MAVACIGMRELGGAAVAVALAASCLAAGADSRVPLPGCRLGPVCQQQPLTAAEYHRGRRDRGPAVVGEVACGAAEAASECHHWLGGC